MANIERIWRITTSSAGRIEVRLADGPRGEPQVSLEPGSEQPNGAYDVEVARAVAQAMLEACEVASALTEQAPSLR